MSIVIHKSVRMFIKVISRNWSSISILAYTNTFYIFFSFQPEPDGMFQLCRQKWINFSWFNPRCSALATALATTIRLSVRRLRAHAKFQSQSGVKLFTLLEVCGYFDETRDSCSGVSPLLAIEKAPATKGEALSSSFSPPLWVFVLLLQGCRLQRPREPTNTRAPSSEAKRTNVSE